VEEEWEEEDHIPARQEVLQSPTFLQEVCGDPEEGEEDSPVFEVVEVEVLPEVVEE
jgi:hypothetical protein